jgi:hypothetical protein
MEKKGRGRGRSRICILTGRNYALNAFRCAFYEAQDVLCDVDDVDLICLQPKRAYAIRYPLQKHVIWRDFTGRAVSVNMVFEPVRFSGEYDLFIAHLPLTQDLIQLSAVRGWRDHCKRSICWIDEEYAANLGAYKNWYSALEAFDHVAIGLSGTVQELGKALNRTCHFVPGAVDVIRYSPHPSNPARVIDIYSIGRIREGVHEAFLDFSTEKNWFYVYDTFLASDARVKDYRQHRQMHANMAKRSRYYHVASAKMDVHADSGGQIEVGFRYYEATAAGAILVGQVPDCETFHSTFNWPDGVIPIQADGRDVPEVVSGLSADPKRLDEISRRNAVEALLCHDWVYRWKTIYEIVGLDATEGMKRREERLKAMAHQIGNAQ